MNHNSDNSDNSATLEQLEEIGADFKRLGQKFDRRDLAAFLQNHSDDLPMAAELIIEHFRPRAENANGCFCRFDEGEGCTRCSSWHSLFHGDMEVAKAPPITFAIENFLQNDAITMIGGLPGAGKTWMMLSMAKALLDGTPLFGFEDFKVATPAEKVVYLCPESSLTPFATRLKLFGLDKHVRGPGHGSLFCRTISVDSENLLLTDLRLHHAVDGAHVFLDTATRFMTGDENSAGEQREFSRTLFQLLQAGAKTVTAAHHAPKGAEHIAADKMTLESVLRGTGELGAMVATCFALKMTDSERTRIHVKHVKYRDIDRVGDFALEGKPWIDQTGDLKMVASPGMAVAPTIEKRNKHAEQVRKAMTMKTRGHSIADIAGHFGVQERTVFRWLSEGDIPDIPVS